MYIPKHFQIEDVAMRRDFIRKHPFATLTSTVGGEIITSHLPLTLVIESDREVIYGHVARNNSHRLAFEREGESLAVFSGPHAYISPLWYSKAPSVPTWNYMTVHAYGRPTVINDFAICDALVADLAAQFEGSDGWRYADLPQDYREKMQTQIVNFRMPARKIEGKFKLSQNRNVEDVAGVLRGLEASPVVGDRELADEIIRHYSWPDGKRP